MGNDIAARSAGLAADDSDPGLPLLKRRSRGGPMDVFTSGEELADAQRRLKEYEGSSPVRQLDPKRVRASQFENRTADSYATADFEELKADIALKGGNSTPIRVRRLSGDPRFDYEIAYGHRRHRACLELGIPVTAEIVEGDDQRLYGWMTDENSKRNDLSPFEWGMHYKRGLDARLFATDVALAAATGRSPSHVSFALAIARLPAEVIAAFGSPLDIQLKWGAALKDALDVDPASVLKKASELKGSGRSASDVFRELAGIREHRAKVTELKAHGRSVGKLAWKSGTITVRLNKRTLTADQLPELRKLLQDFLSERAAK